MEGLSKVNSLSDLITQKGLKFLNWNVRSLFKKIDQCRILFNDTNIDIVAISETWLTKSIQDQAVSINGYNSVRLDRDLSKTKKKWGGGLITYINSKHSNNLQELQELSATTPNYEALWVKINMPTSKDIIVCNFYRPPNGKLDKSVKYLEDSLACINMSKTDVFILGDFNTNFCAKDNNESKKLNFFVRSNQLMQHITDNTRCTQTSSTVLDLAITNCRYVSLAGTLPLYISDHQPIYIIKKKDKDVRPKESFEGRSYRNFDEIAFVNKLKERNWNDKIDLSTVDTAWDTFITEITAELDKVCPIKKFMVRSHKPAWLNNGLLEQMKDRDYFYKKAKRTQDEDDWNIAKHLRNTTNANIRQSKADFILGELEANKKDPKKFWRTIKRVFPSKDKSTKKNIFLKNNQNKKVPTQQVPDFINNFFINIGQVINEGNNTQTQSTGTRIPHNSPTHMNVVEAEEPFEIGETTEIEVYREIMNINVNKSSGIAAANSRVLKLAFKALTPVLTYIFNMSITTATFPIAWKNATVIPIPKAGDKSKVGNYRPISLLPLPGKILEKIVNTQVGNNLENEDYFSERQHGFRRNRSTSHAILQLVNHINNKRDRGTPTAALFIDFRKAFDCVNHEILLTKLKAADLGPNTIEWFEDYLANRTQRVLANGKVSTNEVIKQGVPQGSTLGPLFYIVYANDIPKDLQSQVTLYADDTVIYASSKKENNLRKQLQRDMNKLSQWCYNNKLTINTDKTKLMLFGTKNMREKVGAPSITFRDEIIEEVTHYNYLGVTLDQNLKYERHARAIIRKVSDKLVYLKRIRRFISSRAAINIYKNMILPILEYGNIFLVSIKAELKKKLQILQNKALKCALGLDPLTSTEETHKLAKLDRLKHRRRQHLLQIMFKQKENPFLWKRKKKRKVGVSTRSGKNKQFVLRCAKSEHYKKSVTYRAPELWNKLPLDLQNATDITQFKHKLKSADKTLRKVIK